MASFCANLTESTLVTWTNGFGIGCKKIDQNNSSVVQTPSVVSACVTTWSEIAVCSGEVDGVKIEGQPRVEGKMDPETKRAWRRLTREVRENTPIVLRGLASEGKQVPRKLY